MNRIPHQRIEGNGTQDHFTTFTVDNCRAAIWSTSSSGNGPQRWKSHTQGSTRMHYGGGPRGTCNSPIIPRIGWLASSQQVSAGHFISSTKPTGVSWASREPSLLKSQKHSILDRQQWINFQTPSLPVVCPKDTSCNKCHLDRKVLKINGNDGEQNTYRIDTRIDY